MKLLNWLRSWKNIIKWLLTGIIGLACITYGMSYLVNNYYWDIIRSSLSFFLIISGCVFVVFSIKYIIKNVLNEISTTKGFKISIDSNRLSKLIHENRILINGPKIVAIGGGTGLSTMLRGFKEFSSNITAIVTVADDGGGSGVLRQELGMLPPGDIRNCVLALADTEPIMEKLLQYRFNEGALKGQSFGNLFLAAMDGISDSFEEAVRKMSDVLAVTGKVLPVTLENVKLCAKLDDGFDICGESNIGNHNETHPGKIKNVFLEPAGVEPLKDAIDAIRDADVIIMGPGSLYTSIIPNLLVLETTNAIRKAKAIKIYVCNVMTQPGETEGYTVSDHIKAIEDHSYKGIIDYCFANNAVISSELREAYSKENAEIVKIDAQEVQKLGVSLIEGDFFEVKNNLVRHHALDLAISIIGLVAEKVLLTDKKRSIDYYYVREKLKKMKDVTRER